MDPQRNRRHPRQAKRVAEPEKIGDFVKREMGKSKAEFHRDFNHQDLFRRGTLRDHHQETQERRGKIPRPEGKPTP